MHCVFEERDGQLWCAACQRALNVNAAELALFRANPRAIVRACRPEIIPKPPREPPPRELQRPALPPLFKRLKNFSVAAIGHVLGGCPTCTQDEIDARLAVCQQCPGKHFAPEPDNPDLGICTHPECGCWASRQARFLNKLAWSDQKCPIGAWPAGAAPPSRPIALSEG